MFYTAQHKTSFWKKHALDIGTTIGLLVFFALPLIVWGLGG